MNGRIYIIPSNKLDKIRWDNCIYDAANALVYATSTYLDTMATHWDAMILNDYEYVMPLPWRKKYFISYIYPPAFTQQLGIFSAKKITEKETALFIKAIPAKYKYCEISFNYGNHVNGNSATASKNYLLSLGPEYEALHDAYSRSAIRNITKANNAGIIVRENIDPADIIQMHRERFGDNIGANSNDYENFIALSRAMLQKKQCFTIGAYNTKQTLFAGSIYFLYKNRLTFILNGNTQESLHWGATHLLKDYTIKKFAGTRLILDFEGSDFESFARFYQQFGAKEIEYYQTVILNRLPFFIKFLKR